MSSELLHRRGRSGGSTERKVAFVCGMLSLLSFAGCAPKTEQEPPDISLPTDLRTRLESGVVFDVSENIQDFAEAEAAALRADKVQPINFEIVAGDFEVSASVFDKDSTEDVSEITLRDVRVELGNVSVPKELFPPNGIELTNIILALDEPVTTSGNWASNGTSVQANFSASLVLHWSVISDGRPVPLGDIIVPAVPLVVTLSDDEGIDRIGLAAAHQGTFWRWAKTFEFRDLNVALTGSTR